MSQVKQAQKVRKRSPLMPVFGLLIGVTLAIFSYVVEPPFIQLVQKRFPQAGLTQSAEPFGATRILFTFAIWLALLTLFSIIVAIAAGKSPDNAKDLVMPPRTQAERDERYGGGDSN